MTRAVGGGRGPGRLLLVALGVVAWFAVAGAQIRFTYSSGQSVSPAYEGWTPTPNGFSMYFGYMNTNWLQEFDVPIGFGVLTCESLAQAQERAGCGAAAQDGNDRGQHQRIGRPP